MATNFLDGADLMALAPGMHHDGEGLYLDVRSATSASWLFKFNLHGRAYEMGLGSRKRVDLEAARIKRAWCLAELRAERNPKDTRADMKLQAVRDANAPKGLTVYETAKANVHLIAKKLKTEKGRAAWVRSLHSDFIGYVADMEPAAVTFEDVAPLLRTLYTGLDANGKQVRKPAPVLADDIRQRLSKLLSWSMRRTKGWSNPCVWKDTLEHEIDREAHVEKPHTAIVFAKVGAFLAGLQAEDKHDLRMRLALEWNVISATRANEACGADWSEIEWANDCWMIAKGRMKMRRPHGVPLTTRHKEILELILDGAEAPASGPIFTLDGVNPVSVTGIRKVMQSVQAKGMTLHGFRSCFATWARSEMHPVKLLSGETRRIRLYDEAMVEEALAHAVGGAVRRVYVRDDFVDQRRELLEAWATYCGKVQSNVLPMRRLVRKAA
jgi:integrase